MVAAFVLYLQNVFDPINQLSQLYNTVQSAGAAMHKIFGVLDTQASIKEQPGAVDLPARRRRSTSITSPSRTAPTSRVLHDVTLDIAPGERIALVGPDRRRQVDAGQADRPFLRPDRGRGARRRRRPARRDVAVAARPDRRRAAGRLPVRGHRSATTSASAGPTRSDADVDDGARSARPARPVPRVPRRARHRGAASAARACRRGNASSSRWHAPRWPIRRCSCSTKRLRTSTPAPSTTSSGRWNG